MKRTFGALLLCLAAVPVAAQDQAITFPYDGSFEDATFAVENAIIGKGLVIDHVSHVGDMLNRTGADVGSDVEIYAAADVFLFCSAVLSRKVMELDPMNIAHCPYSVFVTDIDGQVSIGYPTYPEGPMQEVQAFLNDLAQNALDGF
ncbi:protein of unknown function DUF302 [Sulfitobacter marinus]|uniref:DUF302 domain-containing protein n=1 Tax=Sulfitobacter marinus TaxID=394264 RepID=A0A1I6UNF7_9RHOB|nr:DUF302 domain-containing protein [Sulfitobacter marinus]SFT03006.1 protein of unknown function DUF302 [Sulfitobacter marinus]